MASQSLAIAVKCAVRIEDFANVELLRKGLYRIKISLEDLHGHVIPPESCSNQATSFQSQSRGIVVGDSEAGAEPGGLLDDCFQTRSVFMRFSDEVFSLKETVELSFPIPAAVIRDAAKQSIASRAVEAVHLTVALLRADCVLDQNADKGSTAASRRAAEDGSEHGLSVEDGGLRKVLRRTGAWTLCCARTLPLPLRSAARGLHASLPITWDSMHLACTTISIHCAASCMLFSRPERPARPAFVPADFHSQLAETSLGYGYHTEAMGQGMGGGGVEEEEGKGRMQHNRAGVAATTHAKTGSSKEGPSSSTSSGGMFDRLKKHGNRLLPRPGSAAAQAQGAGGGPVGGSGAAYVAGAHARNAGDGAAASESSLFAAAGKVSRALVGLGSGLLQGLLRHTGAGQGPSMAGGTMHFPDDGVLPSHIVAYLNACAAVDAQAHSPAEALFIAFRALRATARASRLAHLYGALVSGYVALQDEDLKAADGAFSAAVVLADSIERREAVESVQSADQVCVSAEDAQRAHAHWLGTLVDACVRLRLATRILAGADAQDAADQGAAAESVLQQLHLHGAGTYCPTRYGPRTRHAPYTDHAREEDAPWAGRGVPGSPAYDEECRVLALEVAGSTYDAEGRPLASAVSPARLSGGANGTNGPSDQQPARGLQPDAFGCNAVIEAGAGSRQHPIPFAFRAVKVLHHAECAAAAVLHEQRLLETCLSDAWRALLSTLSKNRLRADALLQAAYKAHAAARADKAMSHGSHTADANGIAMQPLESIMIHRRTSITVHATEGQVLLDPILMAQQEQVGAKVWWYAPPARSDSSADTGSAGHAGKPSTTGVPAHATPTPLPGLALGARLPSMFISAPSEVQGTAEGLELQEGEEEDIQRRPALTARDIEGSLEGSGDTPLASSSSSLAETGGDKGVDKGVDRGTLQRRGRGSDREGLEGEPFSPLSITGGAPEVVEADVLSPWSPRADSVDVVSGVDATDAACTAVADTAPGHVTMIPGTGLLEELHVRPNVGAEDPDELPTPHPSRSPGKRRGSGNHDSTGSTSTGSGEGLGHGSRGAHAADYFMPGRNAALSLLAPGTASPSVTAGQDVSPRVLSTCPEITGDVHVVVFMNGLGGSVHDTRILRAMLKVQEPHVICTPCAANQGAASEGDLVAAGVRMALEVASFCQERVREDHVRIARLSFVCFSLGGLVTRIALRHPVLAPYAKVLHAFVSIASPHMGLLFTPSLVSTSLYLLQQVRTTPALAQLALSDVPVPGQVAGGAEGGSQPQADASPHASAADAAGPFADTLLYLLAVGWSATDTCDGAGTGNGQGAKQGKGAGAQAGTQGAKADPAAGASKESVEGSKTGSASTPSLSPSAGTSPRGALHNLRTARLRSEPNGVILGQFKYVVLIGSPQDAYAPYHSCMAGMTQATAAAAVVQLTEVGYGRPVPPMDDNGAQSSGSGSALPAMVHSAQAVAYRRMLHGFWHGIHDHGSRVGRCCVRFLGLGSSLSSRLSVDAVLGRQAHVAFLESEAVAAAVVLGLRKLWQPQDVEEQD